MKPGNHKEHIQHTFDSFCKSVLKRTARECYGAIKRRREREVTFSELSSRELASLTVTDEYFTDEYIFSVLGEIVGVTDCDLAEALKELPADKRDIVMMSYFFDMTDREIAERLNMARRTVAYQRTSTLQKLKKIMESED
jgi:RNA polymerase sigma factor (sigma-70 family)